MTDLEIALIENATVAFSAAVTLVRLKFTREELSRGSQERIEDVSRTSKTLPFEGAPPFGTS